MNPEQILADRSITLVDIRPHYERYDEALGLIPASISLPGAMLTPERLERYRSLAERSTPVLYCISGRRSRALLEALKGAGIERVEHLEGGLMTWLAQGHPIITLGAPGAIRPAISLSSTRDGLRTIRSRFMRLLRETTREAQPAADGGEAVSSLERCLDRARSSEALTLRELMRVVDDAAVAAWRLGVPLSAIGETMALLLGALQTLPGASLRAA